MHDYHDTEEGSMRDNMEDSDIAIGDWDYDYTSVEGSEDPSAGVIASVGANVPKSGSVGIAASSSGGAKPLLQASSLCTFG